MKHCLAIFTALALCPDLHPRAAALKTVRVLVWDEQRPEQKQAYEDKFLGETVGARLSAQLGFAVRTATLESRDQGLVETTLDSTDVLIWWGHVKHAMLTVASAERVADRVRKGTLGFLALHSAHWSKPFVRLMQQRAKDNARLQVPAGKRKPGVQQAFPPS
jgi:trehalose utilization protein